MKTARAVNNLGRWGRTYLENAGNGILVGPFFPQIRKSGNTKMSSFSDYRVKMENSNSTAFLVSIRKALDLNFYFLEYFVNFQARYDEINMHRIKIYK